MLNCAAGGTPKIEETLPNSLGTLVIFASGTIPPRIRTISGTETLVNTKDSSDELRDSQAQNYKGWEIHGDARGSRELRAGALIFIQSTASDYRENGNCARD